MTLTVSEVVHFGTYANPTLKLLVFYSWSGYGNAEHLIEMLRAWNKEYVLRPVKSWLAIPIDFF